MPSSPAAAELLAALAGPGAKLKDDQATAISALVDDAARVLVVQATGWGKSAVYFVATALLRAQGRGPTLLISPLLALMRDQIANARRIGIKAETINSSNIDDWDTVEAKLLAGEVDLLCISPERMASPGFRDDILPRLAASVGLVVIDECHCISLWGHDFRSDYRRVADLLALLGDVPVLACTATANRSVMVDVAEQLGSDPLVLRGSLDRPSLALSVVKLDPAGRLAYIDQLLSELPGSGIVYTLTVAETTKQAEFLASRGHHVVAYSSDSDPALRASIEADLKSNSLKAVVATSALGMGFDKPDLAFTIHLGAPSSVIALYQQVGRAGRALAHAEAILLPTSADRHIWEYFDSTAFPSKHMVDRVLTRLAASPDQPVSLATLEDTANLGRGRIESMLKILSVEGAVTRVRGGWQATFQPWTYDQPRYDRVASARKAEQAAMLAYLDTSTCRMAYLRHELDDTAIVPCGRCDNCTGHCRPLTYDPTPARDFLRTCDNPLAPRKAWVRTTDPATPTGLIPAALRAEFGRALSIPGDGAYADVVAQALAAGELTDELVTGFFAMLRRWDWATRPTWVTYVPQSSSTLVADLAARIATAGKLTLQPTLARIAPRPPQADQANSAHQLANVFGAFTLTPDPLPSGPVLLIDDTTLSGWTRTVVTALLRSAGSGPVLPAVLSAAR